jgi:hypothetical protein
MENALRALIAKPEGKRPTNLSKDEYNQRCLTLRDRRLRKRLRRILGPKGAEATHGWDYLHKKEHSSL